MSVLSIGRRAIPQPRGSLPALWARRRLPHNSWHYPMIADKPSSHIVERIANYVDDAGLAVPQENHFLTASKSG